MNNKTDVLDELVCTNCGKKYETRHLAAFCNCKDPKPKYKPGIILKGVKKYKGLIREHYTVEIKSHSIDAVTSEITYRVYVTIRLKVLGIELWKKEYESPCTSEDKMGFHYGIKDEPI